MRLLFSALGALLIASFATGAKAYTERVIHTFCGDSKCGFLPLGSLVSDAQGHIFGITRDGGESGFGTVYELTPTKGSWKFKTIFDFNSSTGIPSGGVVLDGEGNLYGMTSDIVYELAINARRTKWHEKTLHTFNDFDGLEPFGSLTYFGATTGVPYDGISPLYGITSLGGHNEHGVVFALKSDGAAWKETVLYRFCIEANCSDGTGPENISIASPTKIFGTTINGGAACDCGTVFELDAFRTSSEGVWQHKTLHAFCEHGGACDDGIWPTGNIVLDSTGNILGTTVRGGNADNGTIFKVVPSGAQTSESVLYKFCSLDNCLDGSLPEGGLTLGTDGTLFGTTEAGGNFHSDGEVFSFANSQLTVLYAFCPGQDCSDGREPQWPLLLDVDSNLFGVAGSANAEGLVFELSP